MFKPRVSLAYFGLEILYNTFLSHFIGLNIVLMYLYVRDKWRAMSKVFIILLVTNLSNSFPLKNIYI